MSLIEYIFLFLSVIAGGGIAFFIQKDNADFLKLILSFSGAYILGITVIHLLPGVFSTTNQVVSLWILGGFFFQLLLEQLSQGVEHGHVHAHHHATTGFALQIMVGLCLHAFLEGMPLSGYLEFHQLSHGGHQHDYNHLYYGIVFHKIPAAFALVLLLFSSGFHRGKIIFCLVIFAAMSPLGAALSSLLTISSTMQINIIAFIIGSFLHISTTILFEADDTHHHRVSWRKMGAITIGIGLALLTLH